ncbi:hypothetical protein QC762_0115570 [Podospora pseudocomata]|uniref:Uncharacterized protein n=1 Tax=Podospora pseudocomata TaxID=2093779 RepID=A0ABR0G5H6_9PEZI|nr:hypothetical protein QC762_0115570 [Podospora pseudocomata]
MKTTTLYLILTAVAGVLAAPYSEIEAAQLETRATCKSPSICSVFWSGRCEAWCGDKAFLPHDRGRLQRPWCEEVLLQKMNAQLWSIRYVNPRGELLHKDTTNPNHQQEYCSSQAYRHELCSPVTQCNPLDWR